MTDPVKSVADKMTSGVEKDLTARAVNEPRLQAEGRGDKLKGEARTADESDKSFSGSAESKEADDLNRD